MDSMNEGFLNGELKLKDMQTALFPAYKLHYSSYTS